MNSPETALNHLTQAARQASLPEEASAPFGFSTRVLAQIAIDTTAAVWERLGWRSVAFATAISAGCLWWDFTTQQLPEDDLFISELETSLFQP
jgi:hypothetical protein